MPSTFEYRTLFIVATWLPRHHGTSVYWTALAGTNLEVRTSQNASTIDASPRRATVVVEAARKGSNPAGSLKQSGAVTHPFSRENGSAGFRRSPLV
jgi:hypothetical protein